MLDRISLEIYLRLIKKKKKIDPLCIYLFDEKNHRYMNTIISIPDKFNNLT